MTPAERDVKRLIAETVARQDAARRQAAIAARAARQAPR